MVDLNHETIIAVEEVPRKLPRRPNGRRIHISAVYRWMQRGVKGVRLEFVKVGGRRYTSMEALQRFAEQQTETPPSQAVTPRCRQREIERAARRLEEILGPLNK